MLQDLIYGLRTLRRNPAFAAAAILSLALGIGANTAVFSMIYGALLRPLPYHDAARLVRVAGRSSSEPISLPEFERLRERPTPLVSLAGHRGGEDLVLTLGGSREWIQVTRVTAGFFRTLGVAPVLGREFSREETRPGGPPAIILSDGLWQRAFGADPAILGRTLTLSGAAYTVAGVLPPGFWFPQPADAFTPLYATGEAADRGANTEAIARLKPGVSVEQARAELGPMGLTAIPYQSWVTGDLRPKLVLLFGATALLLLIACLNVASLLLARLEARQQEIAVRLALGGSRGRLLRQFFVENAILCAAGGLAGLLGASWIRDALAAILPFRNAIVGLARLDAAAPVFAFAVAAAVALAFSVAPSLRARDLAIHRTLRATARSAAGGQRTRSLLVVSEVALSFLLLVSAALLIESLYRMRQEPLGFSPDHVAVFRTPAHGARTAGFEALLLDRLRRIPGVESAAAVSSLPLAGLNNFPVERWGRSEQSGSVEIRHVTPGYFETMGIPVLQGRSLSDRDSAGGPPVIVINEALARRWWHGGRPLGDRLIVGRYRGRDIAPLGETPREVVAVVGDAKSVYLKEPPRPTVYLPAAQAPWYTGEMVWVVRADVPTAELAERLRQAVASVDPRRRIERFETMNDIVASTMAGARADAWLFGLFGALALALTGVGVYGLLSFSVARRGSELATRMALGASPADVLRSVLTQGLALVGVGLAAGACGALILTRALASLLHGVRPSDPASLVAAACALVGMGLAASYAPARRATRSELTELLRSE